jgi:hypothetical protein
MPDVVKIAEIEEPWIEADDPARPTNISAAC